MQQERASARPQQQQQPVRFSDPQQQAGSSYFQTRIPARWQMGDAPAGQRSPTRTER